MIDYEKILKPNRLRKSSQEGRTLLTESESDRGRVLFCPAFRRLQQKAQVFSMEPNAAVRSRLTHSLEVSQIGRFLVDEICQRLNNNTPGRISDLQLSAMVNFVETACLMHDIGNPPFGHFGEAAVQEWFKNNGDECVLSATQDCPITLYHSSKVQFKKEALADFLNFDGNPQGLRIVTRLQWNSDEYGLNLTKTSLASFLKYVRHPLEQPTDDGFKKKAGFFVTEGDIIRQVWDQFGYKSPQRFPLAYIMEAADDIAYCISDLEDSIEKNVVNKIIAFEDLEKNYLSKTFLKTSPCHSIIVESLAALKAGCLNDKIFTFTDFRTRINNAIVRYAADQYVVHEQRVKDGSQKTLLPETDPPGYLLKVLKNYCRDHVYTHISVQRTEVAGYNAISGLLNEFKPLLLASRNRFAACMENRREDGKGIRILLEPKLLTLFPKNYIKVYENSLAKIDFQVDPQALFKEWNARAHLIVDFISGMTDDFAMTSYRTLAGIEL